MSLSHLSVRNFQSLKTVDLDLGTFTVIVGPSSSGKSALMRAFRALASNVRGCGVITRGQKQLAITATVDPDVKITLERSDRSGAYRLTTGGHELAFTKLAGEVPPHVTQALRLDPGSDSINFAGQFDKPYLLDESGATIARQLGELTNVTAIFEAVRAANRIRASTSATLKTRTTDLDGIKEQLRGFSGLSEQLKTLTLVEALGERRRDLQRRLGRLETSIRALRITETALTKYRPVDLPDTTPLAAITERVHTLQQLLRKVDQAALGVAQSTSTLDGTVAATRLAQTDLKAKMAEVKTCPTCGQYLRYLE